MSQASEAIGHRLGESAAGLTLHAWAPTRASALAEAAAAVLAVAIVPEDVAAREHREVRAQAQTPEALVVAWITECLYVHEIEGFAVRHVEVDVCENGLVHGLLHGEEVAPNRHRVGRVVKVVGDRAVRMEQSPDRCDIVVVLER